MATKSVKMIIKAKDEASKKFGKVGRSAGSMGQMLKKAAMAGAAYFGARAMFRFGADAIRLFGEQEMAAKHLYDALENLGKQADMPEMEEFASQIQRVTTAGDEATLELMSMGASMAKMSGKELKAATIAAMGLAKAYKMDNVAAMRLVARARMGDTASLSRYGIKLDMSLTAMEKFNKVVEIGASNFNLATGEVDTHNGMIAQMTNSWGDLKETLGEAMTKHLPGVRTGFIFLRTVIENWGLVMKIESKRATLALLSFWENTKHLFAVQIPELLKYFKRNWAQIFLTIWDGTAAIIKNMQPMWDTAMTAMTISALKATNSIIKAWSLTPMGLLGNIGRLTSGKKPLGTEFTEDINILQQHLADLTDHFEWTGLLDGFESALEEMPIIAKRQMTKIEKAMAGEFDKMSGQFNKTLLTNLAGEKLELGKILKGSGLSDQQIKNVIGKGGKGTAAKESRLLTTTPGSRIDPAKQTADNTRTQIRLQERMLKELVRQNEFASRQKFEQIKTARFV